MPGMIGNIKTGVKLEIKYARRLLRRLKKSAGLTGGSAGRLADAPVFFANSFPNSGTHLLTQVLEGFPRIGAAVETGLPAVVMYEGATGRERSEAEILRDLGRFAGGDTGYGHLHALPGIVKYLTGPGVCAYFILRDPRDVVVSHVHYVTRIEPNHVHHDYYTNTLKDFESRLRTSILGRPEAANPFPDIAGRFAPFLGWLERDEVLTLKYEDFLVDRAGTLVLVLAHAIKRGFRLTMPEKEALGVLETMINPQRSPTFRQGKSGGWKEQFSPANRELFKAVAGNLLVELGYEKDTNW